MQNAPSVVGNSNVVGMKKGELKVFSSGSKATNIGELMNSPLELCAFLRNRIAGSGMKTGEIARIAKLSPSTVSRMLYGDTKDPRLNTVIQLLMALKFKLYVC
jgi:DNA-binding phage protein